MTIKKLDYNALPLHPQNISGFETGEREHSLLVILAYARRVELSTDLLIDDSLNLPEKLISVIKHKRNARTSPNKTKF